MIVFQRPMHDVVENLALVVADNIAGAYLFCASKEELLVDVNLR